QSAGISKKNGVSNQFCSRQPVYFSKRSLTWATPSKGSNGPSKIGTRHSRGDFRCCGRFTSRFQDLWKNVQYVPHWRKQLPIVHSTRICPRIYHLVRKCHFFLQM